MKKLFYVLLSIGIILTTLSYFDLFNQNIEHLILLIGVILLLTSIKLLRKIKIIKFIILIVMLFICLFTFDYLTVKYTNKIPIFAIEVKSSDKVISYNSIFYRVYNCNGVLTIDNGYKTSYLCQNDDLEKIDINEFLLDSSASYKEYKNKFVHLVGKINTVTGNSSITLESYEDEGKINNYAVFNETKQVQIEGLSIDPTKYHIYDYFEVIARVVNYKKSDKNIIIFLKDAKIIENYIYDTYEIEIENTNTFTKDLISENIYYVGIKSIHYKYTSDIIYSLDYLLLDKRETIDNIIKDKDYKILNENDKLYSLDNYNLLICENKDIVFINKYLYSNQNYCQKEN